MDGPSLSRAVAVAGAGVLSASLVFCGGGPLRSAREGRVAATPDARAPERPRLVSEAEDPFSTIDAAVRAALAEGKLPGCVVVAGRHDEILLRRAYGNKALLPEPVPMKADTVFDLASLTKAVATSSSILLLVERGKVSLEAPASTYVPELAKLPPFTVEQLLLHTSGLPAATAVDDYTHGREEAMRRIAALKKVAQPGEKFVYSDVGYIVLEEIVRRVSGRELADFAATEVFAPLGMKETGYRPAEALRDRAAPTEQRDGGWMIGDVHDPRAYALGGVAGHAGLFSTADDLARFAQAMLGRGRIDGKRWMDEKTFAAWTRRRETPRGGRALGWDVDSAFATHRGTMLSPHSFGHGGFTGTAMWVDPDRDFFFVFLSNRVHPDGKGAVNPLIASVSDLLVRATEVRTGIDVLEEESFERLKGARVGLVTNMASRARDGKTTLEALRASKALELRAIFTPEHGLAADREGKIADAQLEGTPVYSLYGESFGPRAETLAGLDTIVFDLQDVGVRFYTYASTMHRAMRVAAERKLRFVVLDRPNPLNGVDVQGPVLAGDVAGSFVNHHPLPIRHGLTMGELARLFDADESLGLDLQVVRMQGWRRKDMFDRTGLVWTPPSPNLRTVTEAILYPAVGLLEATNLSVGRGTDAPFERIGAPFVDGDALAKALAAEDVPGLSFEASSFTPTAAPYKGKRCGGVRVTLSDRARYEPILAGLAIAGVLHRLYPKEWELDRLDRMLESQAAMELLRAGKPPAEIERVWAADLAKFREHRKVALLY
jgi:uncharacterized protein YbbC (DUF1343 family)